MKLHELDAHRQTKNIAKIFESFLGTRLSVDTLTAQQASRMLQKVKSLVKEHQATPKFHYSEKDPAYLKLIMLEQALEAHIEEDNTPAPMAIDMNDPKIKQTMQKASRGQTLNPDEQKTMTAIALMKKESAKTGSRRMVKESELQQAQVVLAAQDMVDQIQKMTEQISEMQFKDLPALVDSIRNDMGADQASQFQSQASAALSTLLSAVQQGKTALEGAQGTLTGQAPVVPGEEGNVDLDLDATGVEAGAPGEEDMDMAANLDIEADAEDDDEESDTNTLGRERR